jgi:cleavage stimulation factor subunit 3
MDGSLASAPQPLQLSTNVGVGSIALDSPKSISTQRVSDPTTEHKPEESSPKPELPTSEVVQTTTADILQVLQKLQAQQSVTPPTPQLPSFPAKPELQPQSAPVLPKEEPQPVTPSVTEESVSEWDSLRASLRENPHDTEGWNKLVRLAEDSGDLEKVKEAYESLLKMYPNSVRNLQSVVNQVLLT